MKMILPILAVLLTVGMIYPSKKNSPSLHPSDRRVFGTHPCGTPIYSVYEIFSHDRWGNPLGQWVIQNEGHEFCPACLEVPHAQQPSLSVQRS
jgi:hypothetical protein